MGKRPVAGITMAGPRRLALGTQVTLEGVFPQPRVFTIQDRLARRFDDRFDIFFAKHDDAVRFGVRRHVTVYVGTPPANSVSPLGRD